LLCYVIDVTFCSLGGPEGKEVFSEKKGLSIFKDKVSWQSHEMHFVTTCIFKTRFAGLTMPEHMYGRDP
jgi:hypothetical protein